MKIKRFEADNMSEALRMIKKEFGEEAVILSAKTIKKSGRLLGLGTGSQVVVTAAIDQEPDQRSTQSGEGALEPAANGPQSADGRGDEKPSSGIGRILQHFTPITRTGLKKMQPKIDKLMNETKENSVSTPAAGLNRSIYDELLEQGLVRSVAGELADKVAELIPPDHTADDETVSVLAQIIEAKGWVAQRTKMDQTRRIVVVVGPCGAGKTTMIAKMAARTLMQGDGQVGIVSLDDQRIAGTAELEKYAGIMGVPFETAVDADQLNQALQHLNSTQLLLVDTPGLGPNDGTRRDALAQSLHMLSPSEVHLLINAGAQEPVIIKTVNFFRPLGITRLLPTHTDWCRQLGPFVNQVALSRLPISYVGTGAQIPEGLQLLTARNLSAMLLSQEDEKHTGNAQEAVTIIQSRKSEPNGEQHVANRNSDIFHHHQCKAVGRINDGNIVIFRDSREAIDKGYKPCRMCCMSLIVPKPIDRPARGKVAGFRN